MREQKPEQSLNNRRMEPKPSFRKTNFSILCRIIVWLVPFPISIRLQYCFSVFLYCCFWSLLPSWLLQTFPLCRLLALPAPLIYAGALTTTECHSCLRCQEVFSCPQSWTLLLPLFSLLTYPVIFYPNNLCLSSWSQPILPLPNCILLRILLVSFGLIDSFLSTYQHVQFSLIFKTTNFSFVLSPSQPYAVFPSISSPPNIRKALERNDATASAPSPPIHQWPPEQRLLRPLFSLPPEPWNRSTLLPPSLLNHSPWFLSYLSPFILFQSLSFSLSLKQLVHILICIRITLEVLDSSPETVIQVRNGA